jgi:hypothetical protein
MIQKSPQKGLKDVTSSMALVVPSDGPPERSVQVSGCRLVGCGPDDCRQ